MFSLRKSEIAERENGIAITLGFLNRLSRRSYTLHCVLVRNETVKTFGNRQFEAQLASFQRSIEMSSGS